MGTLTTARYFYRCADCLGVFAHGEQFKASYVAGFGMSSATCGACGGHVEYMGRAQRDRLVKDEMRCACDARCTNARGPSCDCHCGGENHGSGLVVRVTVDVGKLPVAHLPDASTHARAAATYRNMADAITATITARWGSIIERKQRREYISGGDYQQYLAADALRRRLNAARAMRAHTPRNKALRQIIGEMGIADPTEIAHAEHLTTALPVRTTLAKQVSLFAFHPIL